MADKHSWTLVEWQDGTTHVALEAAVPTEDHKGKLVTVAFSIVIGGLSHRISVEDAETLIRARAVGR